MLRCGFVRALWFAIPLVSLFPVCAPAQPWPALERLGVEVAPAAGFPVGGFARGDPGLGAGAGLGVDVAASARVSSRYAAYGAGQYIGFRCSECPDFGFAPTVRDVGFEAGAEARFQAAPLQPWFRLGALGHQLQLRDEQARAASRLGWGVAVSAGLDYPLLDGLSLSPSLRFRSYRAVFPLASFADQSAPVRYAAATVGLRYRLGGWLTP
jgi:hypothetical protein